MLSFLSFLGSGCNYWLTRSNGAFRSPNQGSDDILCTWVIDSLEHTPGNIAIQIGISDNSVDNCNKVNGIRIYHQERDETDFKEEVINKKMKEDCRTNRLISISLNTSRVLISFHSNEKSTFKGFNAYATYEIIKKGKKLHNQLFGSCF